MHPHKRGILSIHLESKDLVNTQQLEVAVDGPDGATHLVICTGIANLSPCDHETFTFFVGPSLARRQFVGAIASGALSAIQSSYNPFVEVNVDAASAKIVSVRAMYDEGEGRVKITSEISCSRAMTSPAISYNVSILAELEFQ